MKITRLCCRNYILLLVVLVLSAATTCHAQDPKNISISATFSASPLNDVFSTLARENNLRIYYKQDWLKSFDFTGNFRNEPFGQVLKKIIEGKDLNYRVLQDSLVFVYPINSEKNIALSREDTKVLVVGDLLNQGKFKRAKLQGRVFEGKSGDPLMGAIVFNPETKTGVATDARGRYSIDLPTGQVHLQVSFMSYENQYFSINLIQDGKADFDLFEKSFAIAELTVIGENAKASKAQMSMIRMNSVTMKELPVLMGEADLIKSMVMMPGVQSVGEMSSGFNVRGGNTDQNLILVNGAPVFNTTHLFGFFSMINPDGVEDVTLYKGGIPASFGERISSVMDVRMKQGNSKNLAINGGIGLINSRLTIEGPLLKNKKATFIIGGRSTYSDYLLQRSTNPDFKYSIASFYDVNGALDFEIGKKNHLRISGYTSSDAFNLNTNTLYNYGNSAASFDWKLNLSEKVVSHLTAAYSQYETSARKNDKLVPQDDYVLKSGIQYGTLKYILALYPNEKHRVSAGFQLAGNVINPGEIAPGQEISNISAWNLRKEQSGEASVFADDDFDLSDKIAFNVGIRATRFMNVGPGMVYTYAPGKPRSVLSLQDSVQYAKGDLIAGFNNLEPRFSFKYLIQEGTSFRLSYQRIHQYYNQISNNAVISPTDYWKSADKYIAPLVNDQLAIGYFRNPASSKFETTVELYVKKLQNLIEYKNGASLIMNRHIETDLMTSKGYSYGFEFMLKKNTGRLNGWLSYTYSRTFRKGESPYPEEVINNGAYYPSIYDKPHDLSCVMNYKISRRWRFSSNYVLSSGRPITLPEQKYMFADNQVVIFSERNKYRMPPYHRMDISLTLEENLRKRHMWKGSWTFSVYNVYGRKNTYSVFYKKSEQQVGGVEDSRYDIYRMAIIGIPIPSITYNFRF